MKKSKAYHADLTRAYGYFLLRSVSTSKNGFLRLVLRLG